jgi:hypothetical protein
MRENRRFARQFTEAKDVGGRHILSLKIYQFSDNLSMKNDCKGEMNAAG